MRKSVLSRNFLTLQVCFSFSTLWRFFDQGESSGLLHYTHQYESYDLDGNLLSENMIYNCGRVKHTLDLKARKAEIFSPYFSQKCLYDPFDNLTQSIIDERPTSYTYDDLSQLTSENEETHSYDSLFNRKKKDETRFQTNDLNELLGPVYDLNGNLCQKEDISYIYDPLNRLVEAISGAKKIRFLYDPLGRRLTKIVFEKNSIDWQEVDRENYLYDGQQEIGALKPDGTLKNFRVLGNRFQKDFQATDIPTESRNDSLIFNDIDEFNMRKEDFQYLEVQNNQGSTDIIFITTIAVEVDKKTFVPITDVQGNICRLVDPISKNIAGQYQFTAFGEEKEKYKDGNPWRYAAKRFDPELNLIYFGKRFYDPELGRWLTTDPAGFVDSLNLYQYALNNPFRYYDPDGEFVFLLAIPLAQLLCSAFIIEAVIDAAIVSAVVWGAWEGSKYVNDTMEKRGSDKEHIKNARPSTEERHQYGRARTQKEQRLAEERRKEAQQKSKNRKNR